MASLLIVFFTLIVRISSIFVITLLHQEEVDAGAILIQEAVPVYPDDTIDTLSERVKTAEHRAYPHALELVASGKAVLGHDGHIVWK